MDSRLALEVFAGILVVAGPVLFIAFRMTFREDTRDHPIYRRYENEKKPPQAECRGEMPRSSLGC
jgi:hypothetical protein